MIRLVFASLFPIARANRIYLLASSIILADENRDDSGIIVKEDEESTL